MNYFDRRGQPLALMEWARLMEDNDYRCVAYDEIGPFRVSTVWLGINHNFNPYGGYPIIFETMVFDTRQKHTVSFSSGDQEYDEDVGQWRYPTEEAALAGHDQAIMWAREQVSV